MYDNMYIYVCVPFFTNCNTTIILGNHIDSFMGFLVFSVENLQFSE